MMLCPKVQRNLKEDLPISAWLLLVMEKHLKQLIHRIGWTEILNKLRYAGRVIYSYIAIAEDFSG
jgi:hypothetical protein